MTKRKAIVTGASGLVGSYLIEHLVKQGSWDIVALSRRKPAIPGKYQHIGVDLTDRADVQAKLSSLKDVTHVFFVAYLERSDPKFATGPPIPKAKVMIPICSMDE